MGFHKRLCGGLEFPELNEWAHLEGQSHVVSVVPSLSEPLGCSRLSSCGGVADRAAECSKKARRERLLRSSAS